MSLPCLSVGVLVTDVADPGSREEAVYGPLHFGQLFKKWMSSCQHLDMKFTLYSTIHGELPPLNTSDPSTPLHDLYMITGSRHGAYEEIEWIRKLEAWIREVDKMKIPLIGICFGHQVIGTALGGKVTVNPKGWELSSHSFSLSEVGKKVFNGKDEIKILYTHQDAVVQVPPTCSNLGGNNLTDCQGLAKEGHIVTLQGHPEFDAATLEVILRKKVEQQVIDSSTFDECMKTINDPNDSLYLSCACLSYLNLHPAS